MRQHPNCIVAYLLVPQLVLVPRLAGAPPNAWIATWAASPQRATPDPDEPLLKIEDQTCESACEYRVFSATK